MKVDRIKAYEHRGLGISTPALRLEGQLLFHAQDVADAVGYARSTEILNLMQDYGVIVEVDRRDLGLPGGRAMKFLTREGVYFAVMRARGPVAMELHRAIAKALMGGKK